MDMCDFCGEESRFLYPFDPDGEINVCKKCDGFYGERAREIAFKVKKNIRDNMAAFLEQGCFYVSPDIKAWVKKHFQNKKEKTNV